MIKSSRGKELAGLRIVLISVDGERDTPAVLKDYLKRFSGGIRGPHGAAPSRCAISRCVSRRRSSRIRRKDGDYVVQHSSRVYALDKQGRLRAELYDASPEAIVGIGRALLAE